MNPNGICQDAIREVRPLYLLLPVALELGH